MVPILTINSRRCIRSYLVGAFIEFLAEAGPNIVWQHKESGVLLFSILTDANSVLNAGSNLRIPQSGKHFVSCVTLSNLEAVRINNLQGVLKQCCLQLRASLIPLMRQLAINLKY